MTENTCPKCNQSLGIIAADQVSVGTLLQHRRYLPGVGSCDAVLVVTSVVGPILCVRWATDSEKGAENG